MDKLKRLFIISIMLISASSYAQNTLPVIPFGDRKSDLYYWDTNWYDQYERDNPADTFYPGHLESYNNNRFPGDLYFGRACVADTPIVVKGIAGVMRRRPYPPNTSIPTTVDTTLLGRLTEQFIMYDSDYNILGEGDLYSTDCPAYRMEFRNFYLRDTFDVYEVFFDKPVFVSGQFFIGGTTHNNLLYGHHEIYGDSPVWDHVHTLYPFYSQYIYTDISPYRKLPDPAIYLYRYNSPYHMAHYGNGWTTVTYDTLFHLAFCSKFLPFFAIIDTDYVYMDCVQPTGLGVTGADVDSVVVSWNSSNAVQWDVLVWPDGTEPDSGMLFNAQSNHLALYGLDIRQDYNVKVMAVCDTYYFNTSEWSNVFQMRICDYFVCPVPDGLMAEPLAADGRVIVVWNHSDADTYELAIWSDEENEDNATLVQSYSEYVVLEGLDTARWYSAKIRTRCGCNNNSEWSDTVRFYVPNLHPESGDTTAINDVVARNTHLMPNPTSGKVTILSSYDIQRVELFDNSGKRTAEFDTEGMSVEINLSACAAGTYMVRITTTKGIAMKRLVVR